MYEYAVEPELVSTWHDRKEGAFFLGKFGKDKGRIVSRYPHHWKRLVWDAFQTAFPASGEVARKRMEEMLARVSETMVNRQTTYDGTRSWLENAEAEHARSPFRAVLARANPRALHGILTPHGFDEDEPLWT